MARHSNGKNTFKVAGWVWAVAVIAVVAVIAAIVWAVSGGGNEEEAAAPAPSHTTSAAPTSSQAAKSSAPSAEKATSEAAPKSESTTSPAPESVSAENTLLLLDTSDGLAPVFDPVTGSLARTAEALGAEGKQVAVWNYSSPLNPGVTVGYRSNVGFGPAADAAGTVTRFGTGGVPQTRSAVVAALANASEAAASSGQPVRVLLVTTGTEQDMDDAAFTEAFQQASGDKVSLAVVHVGSAPADATLDKLADSHASVKDASDAAAVEKALKAAAGV